MRPSFATGVSFVSPASGSSRTSPSDDSLEVMGWLVLTAVSGGSASFIISSMLEAGNDGS